MSARLISKGTATSSAQSPAASLRSPPQNSRSGLIQNGSARPRHTTSLIPNGQKSKETLFSLDPDEIFAKHTVHEVKSILHKLRSDVDAKQEELRLMVGERYRDLLQASTSIISMSRSSKRVLDTMTRMKHVVSSDLRAQTSSSGVSRSSGTEDAQLKTFQCLAAHLKLLLDAPEHLWRLLERKRCLHAAWLFLLSRVVYRSLMNESSEEGHDWAQQGMHVKEQFPLVQRQWESVSQFRAQISQRATLSLREHNLESYDLCASLLALHILDSLPLSDALDIFLRQRSRMLQSLYGKIRESWRESAGLSSVRADQSGRDSVKTVWDTFHSVISAIVGTVGSARAVFREHANGSPSMITQVLMVTQSDSPQLNISLPPELCLSSQALLSSLPNSNHFLALPADIRSYRPFIDLGSQSSTIRPETSHAKLRDWFANATKHLHESACSWLSHLETVKKVWEVRSSALEWISASSALLEAEDVEVLRLLIDDVCKSRVQNIWKATLEKISISFRETLQSLALAIAEERDECYLDISPREFLLSAPPIPSVTHASLNIPVSQSSFQRFRHSIQQRIDGVTPLIDKILSDAESAAEILRDDLGHALMDDKSNSLGVLYTLDSEEAVGDLVASVETFSNAQTGKSEHSIRRLYFLGRIAQKLSISPLTSHLRCSSAFSDDRVTRASHIYDLCVEKCTLVSVAFARDRFLGEPISKSHAVSHIPAHPIDASPQLMDSLLFLVDSVEKFGHFKDDAQRSVVVKTILSRFVDAVIDSLRQSTKQPDLRLIWDLCFLKAVCDEWGTSLSESVSLLGRIIKQSYQCDAKEDNSDSKAEVQRSVPRTVGHVRLLLSPLVPPMDLVSSGNSPKPASELSRQKVTSSSTGGESEMQSTLNLVKPSARFGLLWVAGAAAQ